ncbi:tryptophan aminotransferase-related protein 4-like [Rutidosis leptorrhynchoides]|uniref:tryptophan aminotransferase-related protein 4-like n=1 Tax=Rutidosis leptorrhynchoides TaxID=125765 RepID=UPI003A98E31C
MMKANKYTFGLLISIGINIILLSYIIILYHSGSNQFIERQCSLSWSEKAAAEAEAVAAISCSGHGRAYLDGPVNYEQSEGQVRPVCECYDCYGGLDCSILSPECPADADSGDPIFLEPFWMEHATESAVMISGWHRMSYRYVDYTTMSSELEKYIRKMHAIVGNAITEGRYLVFGIGSSQLLNAAVYALSSDNSSSPSNVLATIPFYPMYNAQTVFFHSENFQFQGDSNTWILNNNNNNIPTNNKNVVEFVTSPNNPDGELKTSVVLGAKTIYDHAYFWPHFTPIPSPSDRDLMIFTLSKLTGHAGTRFGWAVIKDKDVYDKMLNYISVADMSISKDTQLRVLQLLKVAVKDHGKPLFEFAYDKMRDRWARLTSVFSKSTRFSLQHRHPLHCSFFNQTRLPSPAYAWVKCEREEDQDCGKVLETDGKIKGRSGSIFSAGDRCVRLSLIKSQDDFELLLKRLTQLVALENNINGGAVQIM